MADRGYRRRRMFIDPGEQLVFALRSTVHAAIFLLAAALLLYGPGENGFRLSEIQRTTNEFLYYQAQAGRLWLLLPALAVMWLVSVIGSHRMVGPVFGFKNALQAVTEKDLTVALTPRRGDHFGDLAVLINDVLDTQRHDLLALRRDVQQAQAALGQDGEADATAAREALEKAASLLAAYRL